MNNVFIVQKDAIDIFDKIRDTYIIGVFSKEELAREFIKICEKSMEKSLHTI